MAKKKKQKAEKKSRLIFRILRRTAIAAAIIGCTVSVISTQSSIAEKKTELAQLEKQIDKLTADNEDLERILTTSTATWNVWHGRSIITPIRMKLAFMTLPEIDTDFDGAEHGSTSRQAWQRCCLSSERDMELHAGRNWENL